MKAIINRPYWPIGASGSSPSAGEAPRRGASTGGLGTGARTRPRREPRANNSPPPP